MTRSTTAAAVVLCTSLVAPSACEPPSPLGEEAIPEPTMFLPGVVSLGDQRDYGIAFSPGAEELYFTRRGRRGAPQIYVARWGANGWSSATVAPFSGQGDEAPFVTQDGRRLLFSSRRPLPVSRDRSLNIWEVARTGEQWGQPRPIAGAVNEPRREIDEYVTGNELRPFLAGTSLLYTRGPDPDWGNDLYVADLDERGAFSNPRPLRISTELDESNAALSPDGRYLVFQGLRRPGLGLGEQDLFVSERTPNGWGPPQLLPEPISSPRNDGYPAFSPDGRYFFFASDRNARGGYYDIYIVSAAALGLGSGGS